MSDSSSANDLAALDRILLRLSGTSNDNLPSVLISLIPKLIPLGNNEALRRKVIEISTEIIRRIKLGAVKLPLKVFAEIIHAKHLPFAPNIGIGLMDGVHSVNCINEVNPESLGQLLDAVLSHTHLTFLSNSTLYYVLQYADSIIPPLLALPEAQQIRAESMIGDYFLDVLLLRDLQLEGATVGSIPPGLSEKRRARLALRKRFLDTLGLHQLKLNVMTYFTKMALEGTQPYLCFSAAMLAKCDSDNAVSLKGIYLLNLINDKAKLVWNASSQASVNILQWLFHSRGLQSPVEFLNAERTGLTAEVMATTLRELLRNWVSIATNPPHALLVHLLRVYSKREYDCLTSDAWERITILLLELLCVDEEVFIAQPGSTDKQALYPLLVESIWALLLRFASSGPTNSGSVSEFRMQTYKLLANMVKHHVNGIVDDPNLLVELLKLADFDEQSAGTPLHKVLQELREHTAFGLDAEHLQLVAEQLDNLRRSQRASSRLLYLQWTKRIFGITTNFLVSLIDFCDDANEMIASYIERQYQDLEDFICGSDEANSSGSDAGQLGSPLHGVVSLDGIVHAAIAALTAPRSMDRLSRGQQRIVRIVALALLQKDRRLPRVVIRSGLHPLVAVLVHRHFDAALATTDAALLVTWLTSVLAHVRIGEKDMRPFETPSLTLLLEADAVALRDTWNRGSYGAELTHTLSVLGFACLGSTTDGDDVDVQRWLPTEALARAFAAKRDRTMQLCAAYAAVRLLQSTTAEGPDATLLRVQRQQILCGEDVAASSALISVVAAGTALVVSGSEAPSVPWAAVRDAIYSSLLATPPATADEAPEAQAARAADVLNKLEALSMLVDVAVDSPVTETAALDVIAGVFAVEHHLLVQKLLLCHAARRWDETTFASSLLNAAIAQMVASQSPLVPQSPTDVRMSIAIAEAAILTVCRHRGPDAIEPLVHEIAVAVLKDDGSGSHPVGARDADVAGRQTQQMMVALLLVLTKHLLELCGPDRPISFLVVDYCLQVLLEILRDSTGLVSDLCTMALNHLHRACEAWPVSRFVQLGPGMSRFRNVADYVAQECLATITRRKRKAQPLGFDASSRGHGARAAVRAERENDENNRTAGPPAGTFEIPVPTTDDPSGLRDALMEAASRMANEQFNVAMDGVTGNSSNSSNLAEAIDTTENGYGAYQKLCQIARRTGDSAVVMMVLAQIRQDITLGEGISAAIYAHYRALTTPMASDRILALVPALYMAKYDPIASIRDIMVRIWKDLVRQSAVATETDLVASCQVAIFQYLASQMLNPMWREREAAALGLEAMMINRSWTVIEPFVSDLLSKCFKLVDDLRESTRKAAMRAFKGLIQHILRACDAHESGMEVAGRTLDLVLPILLQQGILSPAIEARGFSFGLLLKVIDQAAADATSVAGKALEPWLDRLIDALVESISALEPQMLSYLQFHSSSLLTPDAASAGGGGGPAAAGGGGGGGGGTMSRLQAQEEWERLRIELSQHSLMHEALQKCLRLVHFELLPKVANTLFQHLRSGVGLPSRVAAADSVSYLAEQFPALIGGTIGPQVMTLLGNLLSERPRLEMTLKKAMYNAYGVVSKVVPEAALEAEVERLLTRYQELAALTAPATSTSVEFTGALRDKDLELAMVSCLKYLLKRSGDRLGKDSHRMDALWVPLIAVALLGTYDTSTDATVTSTASAAAAAAAAAPSSSSSAAMAAVATGSIAQEWQEVLSLLIDMSALGSRLAATQRARETLVSYATLFLLDLSWERRQQGLQVVLHDLFGSGRATAALTAAKADDAALHDRLVVLLGAVVVQLTYSGPQVCWQGQALAVEALPPLLRRLLPVMTAADAALASDDVALMLAYRRPSSSSETETASGWSVAQSTLLQHKAEAMKELQEQLRRQARQQHRHRLDADVAFLLTKRPRTAVGGIGSGVDSDAAAQIDAARSFVAVPFLVTLLAQQATRYPGGRDHEVHEHYRVTVAKALGQLPWPELLAVAQQQQRQRQPQRRASLVRDLLPTLVRYAGFAVDTTAAAAAAASAAASAFGAPTAVAAATSAAKKAIAAAGGGGGGSTFNAAAMMFGHRYGATAVGGGADSRPKKVARTMPATAASSAGANSPVAPPTPPSPSDSSSPVPSSPVPTRSFLKPPSSSPVFRMHIAQTLAAIFLAQGSSSLTGAAVDDALQSEALALVPDLLAQLPREVWSVKAAVLQWLAAIVHVVSLPAAVVYNIARTVERTLDEPKYAQVKLRSIDVFRSGLEGVNAALFVALPTAELVDATNVSTAEVTFSIRDRIVRPCLRTLALDTTAEVLEAVASLQQRLGP